MKTSLDVLHHFVTKRNKYLVVSIIKEIVSSVLLVVESCLRVGFAMTMSVTMQWIGKLLRTLFSFPSLYLVRLSHYRMTSCRKATSEMMCMKCLQMQPVGPMCRTPSCNGFSMAKYYCSSCKFFDDER